MSDAFLRLDPHGKDWESNVERGSLGKSPRPSRRRKLSLPWKELQGGREILPLLLVLAAFFLDPYKLGFLMETPSPNCHTGLPTNIATVIGQIGKNYLLIFHSVSIENRVQVKKITYHSSLSGESLTCCKEHDPGSWGLQIVRPQNSWYIRRGVFRLGKRQVCRLVHYLVQAPAGLILALGNGNTRVGNTKP